MAELLPELPIIGQIEVSPEVWLLWSPCSDMRLLQLHCSQLADG
jgi:hypothetical protein